MNPLKIARLNPQEVKEVLNSDLGDILSFSEIKILENQFSDIFLEDNRFLNSFIRLKQKSKAVPHLISTKNAEFPKKWHFMTGLNFLDSLFADSVSINPGLSSNSILMLYGKARSGKTQICHYLPVKLYQILHSHQQNSEKFALYIDTEGTFRPDRIKEMAQSLKLNGEQILNQIITVSVQSFANFNIFMRKIEDIFKTHPIQLVLIDSFTRVYRLAMAESPQDAPQIITNMAQNLRKFRNWAQKYNLLICFTSQVSSRFDESYFFEVSPILATTLNRYIKSWILLGISDEENQIRGISGLRYGHIINSESRPQSIEKFLITAEGVENYFG